jgi:hypothetical protein
MVQLTFEPSRVSLVLTSRIGWSQTHQGYINAPNLNNPQLIYADPSVSSVGDAQPTNMQDPRVQYDSHGKIILFCSASHSTNSTTESGDCRLGVHSYNSSEFVRGDIIPLSNRDLSDARLWHVPFHGPMSRSQNEPAHGPLTAASVVNSDAGAYRGGSESSVNSEPRKLR